jgi:hypothetical protein
MQYNYTAQDAADYVDSLDANLQNKLSDESMETLENKRVLTLDPKQNLYHFDNGYAFMYWFNRSKNSYSYDIYSIEEPEETLEQKDGLMQVQCWLAAHEVMARDTYIEPNIAEKMIAEIRAKCNNPDDLQKIKSAVESMLEALN